MFRKVICFACLFAVASLVGPPAAAAAAEGPANRVSDPSFEAPVGQWLAESGKGSYFAARERVAGASDGKAVLAISGWEKAGSRVLSPVFPLDAASFSATVDVRGTGTGVSVELALFDEAGTARLASFGSRPIAQGDDWVTLAGAGVKLATPAARGRLGIVVSGPQRGARVEVDRLGLFAGDALGTVVDDASFDWFEAEDLADGKAWKAVEHYGGWYTDLPSGMKMLAAPHGVAEADNRPASKALTVRHAGRHKLWARVMHTNAEGRGAFTVSVRQAGKVVASREVDAADPALGADFTWCWASLDADLAAGEAEVVLARPAGEVTWIARKVDLFALTNLLDYRPDIQDLRPQGYVRFTNLTEGQDPFCVFTFVHRMQPPTWFAVPGILSAAGFSGSYYVPPDRERWLAAGQSSPWAKLSDALVPAGNHVSLIATRGSHTDGFVQGRVRGRLEFAVGDERRVVKAIDVDQEAPRLRVTLPDDFQNKSADILTADDYVTRAEAALDKLPAATQPVAKHLTLTAILGLEATVDDPRIVGREMGILKRLGFNGTFAIVPPAADAADFHARHGLGRHYGVNEYTIHMVKDGCPSQPDIPAMDVAMARAAAKVKPIMDRVSRLNVGDEPGAVPLSHFAGCAVCKGKFAEWLRSEGRTPADLGVGSWEQVVPVVAGRRAERPELFLYSSLFRLKTFADVAKATVASARRHFPPAALTNVNYSPPANWNHHGTDLFYLQRGGTGGFDMGWSEDWLGYGAGPQHASDLYALLRAAGGPAQPLGGYSVGISGTPLHLRIKLYEMLAAGARHIDVYAYGPEYATVDTWSRRHEIYPVISEALHEFGAIDEALHGTARRKTDVAILYNRTASIWAGDGSTPQQDSYFTRWALCHAGYDADFVPEEDVVAGRLDGYKVLYLAGPQLRRDASAAIAEWVRRGGVLFGPAGAGSRDEFDRPTAALSEVFGAESLNLKLEHDAGRPRFELRGQPALDVLTTVAGTGAPAVTFDQICFAETLKPLAGATVVLRGKGERPAGVLNGFGKGKAVRVAASPGLAYARDALRAPGYDPDANLPRGFRPEVRELLTWPARLAGAAPVAVTDAPLAEVVRYDAQDWSVVFVIDHNAEPRRITLTLPGGSHFTRARSARGSAVELERMPEGTVRVSLPLNVTDAIVLEK